MRRVDGNLAIESGQDVRNEPAIERRPESLPRDLDLEPRAPKFSSAVVAIISATGGSSLAELQPKAVELSPEARTEKHVRDHFEKEFGRLAHDPGKFHAMMQEVYGPSYDRGAAEELRQRAQKGDFAWLPKVSFVSPDTLGGAHGAYDKESGTVYLSRDLLNDPALAAQTFMEEAAHHLDTKLNTSDTRGDEGEMFRRLMAGERLTDAQKAEIRSENDKGTITVNGKTIEVEFWNPFKAVGNAIESVANAVGDAVSGVVDGVGKAVSGVAKGIGHVFEGVFGGAYGFFKNVFQGKFSEAWDALRNGYNTAVFKSTAAVIDGVLDGAQTAFNGVTNLLPDFLRKPVRWVSDRVFDAQRSLITGAHGIIAGAANNLIEAAGTFAGGLFKVVTGDFKDGFKDMGAGLLKVVQTPVDAILLGLGRGVSAIQTLIGIEPVGRKLTDAEIATLKKVYGDSIDYSQIRIKEGSAGLFSTNDRPFTHGNTIYMKENTVTDELLVHEMAHVWQFQNGGTDYMSEAIVSQEWGKGYDFMKSVPGTAWKDLEPEQQAEFLEKAFASGYFSNPSAGFTYNGQDLTAYLETALEEVRNGRGAP